MSGYEGEREGVLLIFSLAVGCFILAAIALSRGMIHTAIFLLLACIAFCVYTATEDRNI